MSPPGDRARATVWVDVPIDRAFSLFTEHIDQWWRRGYRFRHAGPARGILHIEPQVGGRMFERFDGTDGAPVVVQTGTVEAWDPPNRLQIRWRNSTFQPDQATTVQVDFRAVGERTEVTVEHRGWSSLPADHPTRHGQPVPVFIQRMGLWWGDLLRSYREHTQQSG